MDQLGLLIANEDHQASGGATFERRNPISGEVATRAAAATVEDARRAADAAAAAFPAWSGSGFLRSPVRPKSGRPPVGRCLT